MLSWNGGIEDQTSKEDYLNSCKKIRLQSQKKYNCSFCEKYFSTNGNLNNHISSIHENKRPFKCTYDTCQKCFSNLSRLKVHLRTHNGIRPYMCQLCGKSFNENGNLKTHLRSHSEERPFKCNQCEKDYKTNGHLKDHMVIRHLELKKFICSFCNKKFGRSSSLKTHTRIHTKEKPFQCPLITCRQLFSEKGNMQAHYSRHLAKLKTKGTDRSVSFSDSTREKESFSMSLTGCCFSKMKMDRNFYRVEKNISFEIMKDEKKIMLLNFGSGILQRQYDESLDDFTENFLIGYKCNNDPKEIDTNEMGVRVEPHKSNYMVM